MTHRYERCLIVVGVVCAAAAKAQKPTAVRQLGKLERMSTDSLASVTQAVAISGGRVFVNDIIGRRLLLFDSALTHPIIVADTTSATSNAYGFSASSLIRYRGDSALLISPASLSMLVLAPSGKVARVMATPRPDAQALGPGGWGTPGIDARGRLVYFDAGNSLAGVMMLGPGQQLDAAREVADPRYRAARAAGLTGAANRNVDSAFLVRVDLATRTLDSVAAIRIPKAKRALKADQDLRLVQIETTPDPLPLIDGWAMAPDGSIGIVRGRDYHVDWIDTAGRLSSFPKLAFDWQRVTDARKETLIDSAVKEWQAIFDKVANARRSGGAGDGGGSGGSSGGRGGGGGGGGGFASEIAPNVAVRPSLNDLPDYTPPFVEGSVRGGAAVYADADGNLWIRTTTILGGQPVYDIVNRRGELFDRVQLPSFRTIAGFGPGVVYMAVKDPAGTVRLERARVK